MRVWHVFLLCLATQAGALPAASEPPAAVPDPATLVVWNREIVTFRSMLSNLSPEQRRDMSLRRIQDLPKFAMYEPIVWKQSKLGDLHGAVFMSGSDMLFALLETDIDPESGKSLVEAAKETEARLESLRKAILSQRSWKVIFRGIAFSVAMTAGLALFLWALIRAEQALRRFFARWAARIDHLKHRHFDLRPVLIHTVRWLMGLVLGAIGGSAIYLWITGVLSQFPYSNPWASILGRDLLRLTDDFLHGFLGQLPGLIIVVIIFFLTRGIARLISQILQSFEKADTEDHVLAKDTARATRRIAGVLIWVVGAAIAYPYIPGSDSPAFKGLGVLIGLMVSLGSTGVVNQVISGFVVLYSGAVRSGEYAKIGDVEGLVTDIGLLSTKIKTPQNEFITVPNAVLISKEAINYSRRAGDHRSRLSTSVTIGYDTPWRQVHDLLLTAADRTPGIRNAPEPIVIQKRLSDFYVEYLLTFVPAEISKKYLTLSELHKRIQDAFQQAGVQIMSPHFNSQPSRAAIPPEQ